MRIAPIRRRPFRQRQPHEVGAMQPRLRATITMKRIFVFDLDLISVESDQPIEEWLAGLPNGRLTRGLVEWRPAAQAPRPCKIDRYLDGASDIDVADPSLDAAKQTGVPIAPKASSCRTLKAAPPFRRHHRSGTRPTSSRYRSALLSTASDFRKRRRQPKPPLGHPLVQARQVSVAPLSNFGRVDDQ